MRKIKRTGQNEIGRIKLSNTRELVASIIDSEKLDLRVWVDSKNYKGWTKQGFRLHLFDGIYEEFKKLIKKIDRDYEKIV